MHPASSTDPGRSASSRLQSRSSLNITTLTVRRSRLCPLRLPGSHHTNECFCHIFPWSRLATYSLRRPPRRKREHMNTLRQLRNFWIPVVVTVVMACSSNAFAKTGYKIADLGTLDDDNFGMVMGLN